MPASAGGTWIRPEAKKASPSAVPIQTVPVESSRRQFTSSEGMPSFVVWARQAPFSKAPRPPGVASQVVPSALSTMEVTVLDTRPSATV